MPLKPVYFCNTQNVGLREVQAVQQGVTFTINTIQRQLAENFSGGYYNHGNFKIGNGDFNSPDRYQQRARMQDGRIDADILANLLKDEPYKSKNPHLDVFIADQRLTIRDLNFIYGMYDGRGNIVISIDMINERFTDPLERCVALTLLAAHETGHMFYIASRHGRNKNKATGMLSLNHCAGEAGPCIMQQVDVNDYGAVPLQEQVRNFMRTGRISFCPDCMSEMKIRIDNIKNSTALKAILFQ